MQIMASLVYQYQRLLKLDDPSIVTKEHAAAALGMKSAGGARFPLEAAKRLGISERTLRYRLQRIRDMSGHDLNDPNTRFNLQLATRAWKTVQAMRQQP